VEQLCTRVGVVNRGRLVVQDDLAALRGPTGRVIVRSPDADRAAGLLNGRLASRAGDLIVVTNADPVALNAELVGAGLRISEIRPENRSLEDLVLAVTGAGSDRISGRKAPVPGAPAPGEVPAREALASQPLAREALAREPSSEREGP
jgi:ABC-2 type transport system ATP-binding protein